MISGRLEERLGSTKDETKDKGISIVQIEIVFGEKEQEKMRFGLIKLFLDDDVIILGLLLGNLAICKIVWKVFGGGTKEEYLGCAKGNCVSNKMTFLLRYILPSLQRHLYPLCWGLYPKEAQATPLG